MAASKNFGPFELHEKIGSGGMASVYLGTRKPLGRKVEVHGGRSVANAVYLARYRAGDVRGTRRPVRMN